MKPRVYIETTIPSYYFDERSSLARDIARTREWWDKERGQFECVTSQAVLDELAAEGYRNRDKALQLVRDIPRLQLTIGVLDLAELYRAEMLMPRQAGADALHLALVSWHAVDVLLTWNCAHLANTNKQRHLEALNSRVAKPAPLLATPYELQYWEKAP